MGLLKGAKVGKLIGTCLTEVSIILRGKTAGLQDVDGNLVGGLGGGDGLL